MESRLVLGIDCGTQSLRAALYRSDGALLAEASRPYPTVQPRIHWAEQDPRDWWEALRAAVPEVLSRAGVKAADVAAIACDGTSCTLVFCREDGTPLRPAILWMDIRASAEAAEVEETGDPILDYCGRRVSAEWGLPKAMWVARHEPEIYVDADRVVEGADWLVHRLTGRWVTATGNAASKRHWTPDHGWPAGLYEAVDVPDLVEKSPDEVVYAGDVVGLLTPGAAEALGLTTRCVATHANMDGWIAPVGMDALGPGRAALTLGTSSVVVAETATPAIIEGVMGPFPDGIRRDYAVYEAGQTSSGSAIQWALNLGNIRIGSEAYVALEQEAAALPPGSRGLVVFDAFQGNRTPYFDPLARANLCGLTLSHGLAHVYRAVLEGSAYGLRNVLDALERGGRRVQEVRVTGSGAGNRLWLRIIASVTGRPLLVSSVTQATALGAAVCAAVAADAHPDLAAAAAAMAPPFETEWPAHGFEVYDGYYQAYLDTYRQLKGTMHWLSTTSTAEND